MCKIFSGHIVRDTGKYKHKFGEVIFLSGIHHEADREIIYKQFPGIEIVAWETRSAYTFDNGIELREYTLNPYQVRYGFTLLDELNKLVLEWAKKQNTENLLRGMIRISRDGVPVDYTLDMDKHVIKVEENNVVIDCPILHDFTIITGDYCFIRTGYACVVKAGYNATILASNFLLAEVQDYAQIVAGDNVNIDAGRHCSANLRDLSRVKAADFANIESGERGIIVVGDYSNIWESGNSEISAGEDCTIRATSDARVKAREGSVIRNINGTKFIRKGEAIITDTSGKTYPPVSCDAIRLNPYGKNIYISLISKGKGGV